MNKPLVLTTTLALSVLVLAKTSAQESKPVSLDELSAQERGAVVERISEMLVARYVFPEVAESCAKRLRSDLEGGVFDGVSEPKVFAGLLTEALQAVSKDKHLRVSVQPRDDARRAREAPALARARQAERERAANYGFASVELLEGNVGYLDMRYFSAAPEARPTATAALTVLAGADALVFDMRRNGGGDPDMIRHLSSSLFDEATHLNSLYWRKGDRTVDFVTDPELPGPRLGEVPVFVLTSDSTFSGAEEFAYNLQTQERGTLIGETTGGGANPGGRFPVNERFGVFVPMGRAVNPITGTNWEGVGVVPDIAVDSEAALETALPLARAAAAKHAEERGRRLVASFEQLQARIQGATNRAAEGDLAAAAGLLEEALDAAREQELLNEADVNALGYQLLGAEQVELALTVFRRNVADHPESFNAHDSLGEGLMKVGRTELAIRSYRRSLELEPANANAEKMIALMQGGDGT